jgi:hypothetical protein
MKIPSSVFLLPVAMALIAGALCAQQSAPLKDPPKPVDYSYKASEAKDLRIAQLEFRAASRDLEEALRDWNQACQDLRVVKAWPEGTACNIQTGEIIPPAPDPPKPHTAPEPSKPGGKNGAKK